jgi:16S rRNA processing protein RimM
VLHPEGTDRSLTIVESAAVADGPGWWLRFREVADRAAAEPLRGVYLEAEVAGDSLPEGEVYWHEVIGVPVVDLAGDALGSVAGIYRAGAAEILVVEHDGRELDIPNVATIVRTFAPREGRIVVDRAALDLPAEPAARRPRGRRTRRAFDAAGTGGAPDGLPDGSRDTGPQSSD